MTSGARRLRRRYQARMDDREPRRQVFRGILGDGSGEVRIAGEQNKCYVRIEGRSRIDKVINVQVPAWEGLPVVCSYSHENPSVLQVLEVDFTALADFDNMLLVEPHHETHELLNPTGGHDVVWVHKSQFTPGLGCPTSPASMQLQVFKLLYRWASGVNCWPGDWTVDLSAYIPTATNSVYVLVSIDGVTNLLQYTPGPEFPSWPASSECTSLPTVPAGCIPIQFVLLWAENNLLDNDLTFNVSEFEDPGGGGPDIWAYWTEFVGAGALANDAVIFYGGANSCQTTEGGGGRDTGVYQDFHVEPGERYQLRFWNRGDGGANDGGYRVRDQTNGVDIIATTGTGQTAAAWAEITAIFNAPATCTTARVYFYCPAAGASQAWFDTVTVARVISEVDWPDLMDARFIVGGSSGSVAPAVDDWIGLSASGEVVWRPDNPVHYDRGTGVITEYATIQLALNACGPQDAVLVPPGAYMEALTWPNVNWVHLVGWGVPGTADGGHTVNIVGNCSAQYNAFIYGVSITGNFTLNGASAALHMLGSVLTGDVIDGGTPGDLYVETSTITGDIDVDNLTLWDGRITGTLTVAGTTTHRGAPNMDTVVDGIWTFDEEIIQAEQAADPGSPGAGYSGTYPKDDAGQTKRYFMDDTGGVFELQGIAENVTKTVQAVGGDFTAVQDAIDWFKNWITKGACVIQVEAGTYDELLNFNNMIIATGSSLKLEGDLRLLAGMSFFDGAMSNREGLLATTAGTANGVISLVGNGGQPVITVTNAGANNPDFDVDPWVNGDRILVNEWNGAVFTQTEYTISTAVNNVITLTGNMVNGGVSTLGVGDDGAGITLVPNRRVEPTSNGVSVNIQGTKGPEVEGFFFEPNGTAYNGFNVEGGGQCSVDRVVVRNASLGLYTSRGSAHITASQCVAVWDSVVGGYARSFASGLYMNTYAVGCTYGFAATQMSFNYARQACSIACTAGCSADGHSHMYTLESTARHCATGYQSLSHSFVNAAQTGNQNNNPIDYAPAPPGPGVYAQSPVNFAVLVYTM